MPAAIALLALAVAAGTVVPVHAAARYQHMTIHAAVRLCKGSRLDHEYRIAVRGFFRSFPENHGPDSIAGALFDSDRLPRDAAVHYGKYGGLEFGTMLGWRYEGSIDGITRPHARVAVRGELFCSPFRPPFLKPDAISVSGVGRSPTVQKGRLARSGQTSS